MTPRIGLGVSDFRKVREQGYAYIDKTLLLRDFIDDGAEAILVPRPRRFGKTTNLSMVRAYFDRLPHKDSAARAERWALFADLAIAREDPAYHAHFARYPTIALSFKDVKTDNWPECQAGLVNVISAAFLEHRALLTEGQLGPEELLWSLLLFTGYLKPVRLWRAETELYGELAIPNKEVLSIYKSLLRSWAEQGLGGGTGRRALSAALLRGQAEEVEALVQHWLLSAVSFYDTAAHSPPERFYHGFVLGLLVDLSGSHLVTSNRESGYGRCDVLLTPRKPGSPGVALELKVPDKRRDQTVKQALEAAHSQLRERDYAAALRAAGASPIHSLALVFDGKEVHVSAPAQETGGSGT